MRCTASNAVYAPYTRVDSRSVVRILLVQAYVARRASPLHMSPYSIYDVMLFCYYIIRGENTWTLFEITERDLLIIYGFDYIIKRNFHLDKGICDTIYTYLSISTIGHCIYLYETYLLTKTFIIHYLHVYIVHNMYIMAKLSPFLEWIVNLIFTFFFIHPFHIFCLLYNLNGNIYDARFFY